MIPKIHLVKGSWYEGVSRIAQWTGCTFVTIEDAKPVYMNHIEESVEGFEPLSEINLPSTGRVWALRDLNQIKYIS